MTLLAELSEPAMMKLTKGCDLRAVASAPGGLECYSQSWVVSHLDRRNRHFVKRRGRILAEQRHSVSCAYGSLRMLVSLVYDGGIDCMTF